MTFNRTLLLPAAVAATLLLVSCGGDDGHGGGHRGETDRGSSEGSGDQAAYNAADVEFAQAMIPHHQQAVEMAELAADRAERPEVAALAEAVEAAQAPEIAIMTGWLTAWGEEVPGTDDATGGHGGHGDHGDDMPGMLDDDQLSALADASGAAFDTLFMELMIEHHEGAVTMAGTQLTEGTYGPAKELARAVVRAQQAEIDEMNRLLGNDTP